MTTESKALARRPTGAADISLTQNFDLTGNLTFHELLPVCKTLVESGMLPESIKTPQQALAIVMQGRELGLPTMLALRKIDVIKGKPTLAAELQLALFKARGGRSQVKEHTDKLCSMWFRHPNGDEHVEEWTLEMAQKAGIMGNSGWKTYPKLMLRWRCISAGLKIVAPDIVSGVYDPEELGAQVSISPEGEIVAEVVEVTTVPAENPKAERLRQQHEMYREPGDTRPAPQPGAPIIEPGDAQEPDPAATAEPRISDNRLKQLWALAKSRDLQGDSLTELKKIIAFVKGIPVDQAQPRDLTEAEYRRVCDEIEQYPPRTE